MIFRFFSILFCAAFALASFDLSAQNFAVVIDSAEAQQGKVVCVPVRAQGFFNIVGYQYSLEFNDQVLTFHHAQNFNLPDMGASNFNIYLPGVLTTAWTDPNVAGITRENGSILYEVCFTAIGNVGSSSLITPGGTLPPDVGGAGVYDFVGNNLWNANANVPGLVEITLASGTSDAGANSNADFQLSPNPTASAAQVLLKSVSTGNATLSVTDALGRVVFETKTKLRAGDNRFDIPAEALKAKGMYQVSLQTEQGVSTQMLSVQ